ncbi:DUF5131 family protein [Arenimonas sp.]|uniref:DUF5131 family protein n=1 Tax=Arenimonas sp. TaxID=1872635 RepID=UPI0039E6A10A
MTTTSRIEWTERTWNPVVGCTKISAGCKFCYAEVMARRLQAIGAKGYEQGFKTVRILPERLRDPVLRRPPTLYFVNSMSDLFHDQVPEEFIDQVFEVMRSTPRHTYQVLTKRGQRLARYARKNGVPDNVWIGVSVENKRHGVPRIAHLQSAPAATRFLSVEPLLEDVGVLDLSGIDWVIVGGESGHKARPMDIAWARNVQRQCLEQGVLFFFKQWGNWGPDGLRRTKKANGRKLDGRTWDEMPSLAMS